MLQYVLRELAAWVTHNIYPSGIGTNFDWWLACVPSRDIADILKAFYFRNFESTYRILHIPSFNNEYERYWGDPSAVDDGWVFLLLLVLAIGSCFVRDLAWYVNSRLYLLHGQVLGNKRFTS